MGFLDKVMEKIGVREDEHVGEEGYVELDTESGEAPKSKVIVRPFVLHDFDNIKDILDAIRGGNTIALVNMKPLKEKDLIELKRAINKLKKTTDAIEGEIAGFGEDYIVICPSFATIHRTNTAEVKPEAPMEDEGSKAAASPELKEEGF